MLNLTPPGRKNTVKNYARKQYKAKVYTCDKKYGR